MPELIHEHMTLVQDSRGINYKALVYGEERRDGTWVGWIEFHPLSRDAQARSTGAETSQPDKPALVYWATGLEPVYLEGALERARQTL
jgi:hypothetical protein